MFSFKFRPFYAECKAAYSTNKKLDGLQRGSGHFQDRNLLSVQETAPRVLDGHALDLTIVNYARSFKFFKHEYIYIYMKAQRGSRGIDLLFL